MPKASELPMTPKTPEAKASEAKASETKPVTQPAPAAAVPSAAATATPAHPLQRLILSLGGEPGLFRWLPRKLCRKCFVGKCSTGKCSTGKCSTGRCSVGKCSTAKCSVAKCSTAKCSIAQCSIGSARPANAPPPAAPTLRPARESKTGDTVAVEMSRQGANLKLTFPFSAPTAAAVFHRADTLSIMFEFNVGHRSRRARRRSEPHHSRRRVQP